MFLKGFTIIEVLLVIAVLAVLLGLSVPVYQSFYNNNELDVFVSVLVQSLRRAKTLSMSVEGDSQWGLKIETGYLILFKGSSFSARDPGYDEVFSLPNSISFSGLNEITFSKLYGIPGTTGNISLSLAGKTIAVNINEKGTVSY